MERNGKKENLNETKELLRRGGRALGLAALAHYHHGASPTGRWHVLDDELTAPAAEIVKILEARPNPVALDGALKHAMSHKSTTSPPAWALELIERPHLGDEFTSRILNDEFRKSLELLFPRFAQNTPKQQMLTVLAVSLCRNLDTVRSLSTRFDEEEGRFLFRNACLAAVTAPSGLPSSMRNRCRQIILGDLA